jgi:hypothetical protein
MMEKCIALVGMIVGSLDFKHLLIITLRMQPLFLKHQHRYAFLRRSKDLKAVKWHADIITQLVYLMVSYSHGAKMIQDSLVLETSVKES